MSNASCAWACAKSTIIWSSRMRRMTSRPNLLRPHLHSPLKDPPTCATKRRGKKRKERGSTVSSNGTQLPSVRHTLAKSTDSGAVALGRMCERVCCGAAAPLDARAKCLPRCRKSASAPCCTAARADTRTTHKQAHKHAHAVRCSALTWTRSRRFADQTRKKGKTGRERLQGQRRSLGVASWLVLAVAHLHPLT